MPLKNWEHSAAIVNELNFITDNNEKFSSLNLEPRLGSVKGVRPFAPNPSGPLYDVKSNKLHYFAF